MISSEAAAFRGAKGMKRFKGLFVGDIILVPKTETISSSSKYSDGCLASAISFKQPLLPKPSGLAVI